MMVSATRGGGRPACPLRERPVTVIGAPPLAVRLKVGRRPSVQVTSVRNRRSLTPVDHIQ